MTGALVVSLHDVCPRTQAACQAILTLLDRLGIRRRSLLVIPCDPGGAADEVPAFAGWLRERAAAGDEIVQHGLHHHRRDQPPLRGGPARLDALLARGAGEFLGLDYAAARDRLEAGRRRLVALGLEPIGFVAPAWLYSSAAAAAVRDAGFAYLTTHLRLRDLRRGRDHWSFGISNRPGPLGPDLLGRAVNEILWAAHLPAPLVRIAIHPADLSFHRPIAHTLSLLRRLATRRAVTYAEYLDAAR